ncbi:MAG: hypothetical protein U0324_35815 [Polyangiales bacterium]
MKRAVVLGWVFLASALGCSAKSGGGLPSSCTPGASVACSCPSGAPGVQACSAAGTLGECACADGGAQDVPAGMDGPPVTDGAGGDASARGPVFLSFGTNVMALTETDSVTFTAVLTDPDGSGDLVGGALLDESGMARYGAFMASGGTGAYSLTVTWAQVHAVGRIEFRESESRVFLAEFFDMAGNRSTRTVTLRLHCDGRGGGACNGRCTNLSANPNCGGCGVVCPTACDMGTCPCPTGQTRCGEQCVNTMLSATNCGGCGQACAPGFTCQGGFCTAPSGGCSGGTTCTGCSARPGCGWCGASSTCFAGTATGPVGFTCASGWTFEPVSCPGAVRCSAAAPTGLCEGAGETCVRGTCQRLCGGVICTPEQVCIQGASGLTCATRCTSRSDCTAASCCVPLYDGTTHALLSYGACDARAPGQGGCPCTTSSDCPGGTTCAPGTNTDGDPVGPYVCRFDGMQAYQGCSGGSCPAGLCCVTDPRGNRFCARPCTSSATCGMATCRAYTATCGSTFCGPP